MITIIAFLFVFTLVVISHELGHFILAKCTGIKVNEFALGFGKRIYAYKYGETLYSINIIPLGGFVKLEGMALKDGEQEHIPPYSYIAKKAWQKILVIIAGPMMNFVLATILFFILVIGYGIAVPSHNMVIGKVMDDYPAKAAGLKPGDRIIAINNENIETWKEMNKIVGISKNYHLSFDILKADGTRQNLMLKPLYDEKSKRVIIGIVPKIDIDRPGVIESAKIAAERTLLITAAVTIGLVQMVRGKEKDGEVAGPVGIAQMAGKAAKMGWERILQLTAVLSVNLGLFNLLPLPALDGGRLAFLFYELVRGKGVDSKKEAAVHIVGFLFLIGASIFVTFKDILKLFN